MPAAGLVIGSLSFAELRCKHPGELQGHLLYSTLLQVIKIVMASCDLHGPQGCTVGIVWQRRYPCRTLQAA